MSILQNNHSTPALPERLYDTFIEDNDDEGRVCRDIPDEACDEQPLAFTYQLIAQTLTKFGDTIVSPRLVLAWMLSTLGSPAIFISLLVPVRESLSLVPQLFVARYLREQPLRKHFWVMGSIGQAIALAGMVPAILVLEGAPLGASIIALLAIFSLCRGVCSVSAKDVLGKTISKTRRGRLNGLAASTSGLVALITALLLLFHDSLGIEFNRDESLFVALTGLAAILWLLGAIVYSRIPEVPGSTQGGGSAIKEAIESLSLLRDDPVLRAFVISRSLMISVAIAIPYLVVMIQRQSEQGFGNLGALLLAEGLAALVSGHIWGTWSDRYAHLVMAGAAGFSAALFAAVIVLNAAFTGLLGQQFIAALVLFLAAACHQGIRIARKTYLVDIATSDNRASYTAVSNTVIGILVATTGIFGFIDAMYGTSSVLGILAVLAAAGAISALQMKPAT